MKIERHKKRSDLILELTPLIDVVFLLIIFFLVATTFNEMRGGIKIDLPHSTIKEVSQVREMQVVISKDKNIVMNYKENNKNYTIPATLNNLKSLANGKLTDMQEKNVVISADKSVDYGFVVDVMTLLKEAGAESLDIDTQK